MNIIQYLSHNRSEVMNMAKKGMKRPEYTHNQPKNDVPPVPEIQGKAKSGKIHTNPIIAGTGGPSLKVWHNKSYAHENPISSAYSTIDNDIARDNLENDIPAADLQDI